MKLAYNVKDKPKFGQLIVFAFQQLLAILAATIAVPNIVGHGMQPSAALFGAGMGTIVYLLFTKFKSPVFLGSSFAFLGSMAAAFAGGVAAAKGYAGLIIGAVFAGLVYVVIAIIVKFAGVKWINKLMPAVVIGPTVAIIGLSLAVNAVGDLQSTNYTKVFNNEDFEVVEVADNYSADYDIDGNVTKYYFNDTAKSDAAKDSATGSTHFVLEKGTDTSAAVPAEKVRSDINVSVDEEGNMTLSKVPGSVYVALCCGLITLIVTILCSVYGKKTLKAIPFVIGILAGYATAAVFTLIGMKTGNDALMVIDFSAFNKMEWVPKFTFVTAFGGFKDIDGEYLAKIAVAYIPVALVVFAEHIADHKNISTIIETDLLEEPGLHRTLLGDGVGSMVGAFFGGCPNTTYGESIGCVAISGNASVITILTTSILAIVAAFVAPFTTFLATIPKCVMGGVCIALYGFIAVSGLKMIQKVDLEENKNLFVVSVILIAGVGGLAITFGKVTLTEVATALILGIIVNLIVSGKKDKKTEKAE